MRCPVSGRRKVYRIKAIRAAEVVSGGEAADRRGRPADNRRGSKLPFHNCHSRSIL
jgi:hypothetical protein